MLQHESWNQRLLHNLRCLSGDDHGHTKLAKKFTKYNGQIACMANLDLLPIFFYGRITIVKLTAIIHIEYNL